VVRQEAGVKRGAWAVAAAGNPNAPERLCSIVREGRRKVKRREHWIEISQVLFSGVVCTSIMVDGFVDRLFHRGASDGRMCLTTRLQILQEFVLFRPVPIFGPSFTPNLHALRHGSSAEGMPERWWFGGKGQMEKQRTGTNGEKENPSMILEKLFPPCSQSKGSETKIDKEPNTNNQLSLAPGSRQPQLALFPRNLEYLANFSETCQGNLV